MSTNELPDFTTAPAWANAEGVAYSRGELEKWVSYWDREADLADMGPWTPLMTPRQWAEEYANEKCGCLILGCPCADTPAALEVDTADGWGKRLDPKKLAEVIASTPNPAHAGMGTRHIGMSWAREMVEAVLAAMPELMDGSER